MNISLSKSNQMNTLAKLGGKYLVKSLNLQPKIIDQLFKEAKDKEKIIEFAHTPSFFHLGIVRCFLHFIAASKHLSATKIFFINDHLSIKSLKECKGIPIILPNNKVVSKYPSLNISKKKQYYAISKTEAPNEKVINNIYYKLCDLFPKNRNNITFLKENMLYSSEFSSNLGAWFVNLLFRLTNKYCFVIPTSSIGELDGLLKNLKPIVNQNCILYCKKCGARKKSQLYEIESCQVCHHKDFPQRLPNVILRQNIANYYGVTHRVSGNQKSYQAISDKKKIFTKQVPSRIRVSGKAEVIDKTGNVYKKMNFIQYLCLSELNLDIPKDKDFDWTLKV